MFLNIAYIFIVFFGIVNCTNDGKSILKPKCRFKEVFMTCGPNCPVTCANLGETCPIKQPLCPIGCFCKDGFARNKKGYCIWKYFCPPKPKCLQNEEYKSCGPGCPPICTLKLPNCTLPTLCPSGCFCKEGFIRAENKTCIPTKDCKFLTIPIPKCPDNEEYKLCGPACAKNCTKVVQNCTIPPICPSGCFCKEGFIRDDNKKCIPIKDCKFLGVPADPKCPDNEEYKSCGPACPSICTKDVKKCTIPPVCPKGCYCKANFIRDEKNKCIPVKDCKWP